MKIIEGRLNYSAPPKNGDVLIFTANSYVKTNGALVMGRGAAKQVRDTHPCVQFKLGQAIETVDDPYYLINTDCAGFPIYAFQVKYHFKHSADLVLIEASVDALTREANEHPRTVFHMNYPGIGNGSLGEAAVRPLLDVLPGNVLIYK